MSFSRTPSILQLVCHDLGRHVGPYGVATVATPALDRLAAEGVRFANSFCTSPGCSPSRAALATRRYPPATGCLGLPPAHRRRERAAEQTHGAPPRARGRERPARFAEQP